VREKWIFLGVSHLKTTDAQPKISSCSHSEFNCSY
jgi:hypothetical protein